MKKTMILVHGLIFLFPLLCFGYQKNVRDAQVDNVEIPACLGCHAISKQQYPEKIAQPQKGEINVSPLLPKKFSADYEITEISKKLAPDYSKPTATDPPYIDFPNVYQQGRGKFYYDWDKRLAAEVYYDFCVPIFPRGSKFKCKFLGIGDTSYLITYDKQDNPSCCQFMKPFGPPKFAITRGMQFHKTTKNRKNGHDVDWWTLPISMPGPFGIGFDRDTGLPVGFWFQSVNGWAQMNYTRISLKIDDPGIFELPAYCQRTDPCNLLGLDQLNK